LFIIGAMSDLSSFLFGGGAFVAVRIEAFRVAAVLVIGVVTFFTVFAFFTLSFFSFPCIKCCFLGVVELFDGHESEADEGKLSDSAYKTKVESIGRVLIKSVPLSVTRGREVSLSRSLLSNVFPQKIRVIRGPSSGWASCTGHKSSGPTICDIIIPGILISGKSCRSFVAIAGSNCNARPGFPNVSIRSVGVISGIH